MKSIKTFIATASVALLASGVTAQAGDKKFMSADEVKKAFAKGSITCDWKAGKKGRDKGTDFYFKDASATSGSADRNIGKSTTMQGKWSISGDTLSLQFGVVGEALSRRVLDLLAQRLEVTQNGFHRLHKLHKLLLQLVEARDE